MASDVSSTRLFARRSLCLAHPRFSVTAYLRSLSLPLSLASVWVSSNVISPTSLPPIFCRTRLPWSWNASPSCRNTCASWVAGSFRENGSAEPKFGTTDPGPGRWTHGPPPPMARLARLKVAVARGIGLEPSAAPPKPRAPRDPDKPRAPREKKEGKKDKAPKKEERAPKAGGGHPSKPSAPKFIVSLSTDDVAKLLVSMPVAIDADEVYVCALSVVPLAVFVPCCACGVSSMLTVSSTSHLICTVTRDHCSTWKRT